MARHDVEWLIIDGYSLMHRDERTRAALSQNIQQARLALIRQIERTAGAWAPRVTVVFDGQGDNVSQDDLPSAIEVLYAPGHLTADSVIERMTASAPDASVIMVVTSDRLERETVMASGALSMSCGAFLEQCARDEQRLRQKSPRPPSPKRTLGDYFPDLSG
jgi:predicted RNA-binding protein with PIN domain